MKSEYYVGRVKKSECWFLSVVLRGSEHVAFSRCIDKKESVFEFFVSKDMESIFLEIVTYLKSKNVLLSLLKTKNKIN